MKLLKKKRLNLTLILAMNNSIPAYTNNDNGLKELLNIKDRIITIEEQRIKNLKETISLLDTAVFDLHKIVELKENKINDLAFENVKFEYEKHKAHVVNIVLGSIIVLLLTTLLLLLLKFILLYNLLSDYFRTDRLNRIVLFWAYKACVCHFVR